MGTCYACEREATTVEHCPPKSLFPAGQREQLLTVPSCAEHNNDNSKDVEYVRNALTTLWGANESALEIFDGPVKRSFDRRPALGTAMYSTMQTVLHEGQITGAFQLDLDRLVIVFKACARAIHYHETVRKQPNWGIVMPRLQFAPGVTSAQQEPWQRLCHMLQGIQVDRKPICNPQVFEYGTANLDGNDLYCFVFYQNFVVYALPLREGFGPNSIRSVIQANS